MLRESDIYVLGGLLAREGEWTYRNLADDLHVPHSVVQRALARAEEAGLYNAERREVHRAHFEEFAVHALRFVAPARLGPLSAGVPAAWAAEPMAKAIVSSGDDPPPVWPHAEGGVRGQSVEPLHAAAPDAVAEWAKLGEVLASLDSLRVGDVRVRSVAEGFLAEALRKRPDDSDR
jgi:DNA-binding transcriptional MocR family regulator